MTVLIILGWVAVSVVAFGAAALAMARRSDND